MADITTGNQTRSAAGAFGGTLDTSALAATPGIALEVSGLDAGAVARIAIEDTAHATPFSDALPVAVFHVVGEVQPTASVVRGMSAAEVAALRRGAANNKLRANLLSISAGSVTVHAYTK